MFASEHESVVPDILCVGKALGNGFPISAAVASSSVMDAWPASEGEALHTSTHLGNPMGCAAALASIAELEGRELPKRAALLGGRLESMLKALQSSGKVAGVRGRGLMWGVELHDAADARAAVEKALTKGVIILRSGVEGNVLSLTPPLTIPEADLELGVDVVASCIA